MLRMPECGVAAHDDPEEPTDFTIHRLGAENNREAYPTTGGAESLWGAAEGDAVRSDPNGSLRGGGYGNLLGSSGEPREDWDDPPGGHEEKWGSEEVHRTPERAMR
ncbi:hypothetical protein NDU88_011171 [Pleurodeles waltl]|uniref:Uncharacterized protein n=1 Tax=Pleurodeles waltl TaxID=8319 RepID=A0AAV7S2X1_PLEWA|nr:hypothetical protein NDU88_011171 [Pleurodeles waltl]